VVHNSWYVIRDSQSPITNYQLPTCPSVVKRRRVTNYQLPIPYSLFSLSFILSSLSFKKNTILLKHTQIKSKPWGEELWFAHTDKYAGKILRVKKGHRLSLQYHEVKLETQYLFKGQIKLTIGADKNNLKEIILNPGDKIDLLPGTIHRVYAIKDSEIFEVSSPELDDVIRIEDDYKRK